MQRHRAQLAIAVVVLASVLVVLDRAPKASAVTPACTRESNPAARFCVKLGIQYSNLAPAAPFNILATISNVSQSRATDPAKWPATMTIRLPANSAASIVTPSSQLPNTLV